MRTKTFVGLLSCMLFVLTINFIPSVFAASSEEQELIKLETDWGNAIIKRDVAFLDRVMTEDSIGTDYEGVVHTGKAEYLADIKSGANTITSIVVDDMKARVWGDAGVVWGRTTEKSQNKGKDTSGTYQWTDTWIKINGRWQCVAGHGSKVIKK
jgi:ketosteroid isomerase-like protein